MNINAQDDIKAFCRRTGMKKKDIAQEIGITPVMLSHWLHGRAALSDRALKKLVILLDKSQV